MLDLIQGYKTIIGIVALIAYKAAVQHGILAEDPTIEAAINGWIIYGVANKIDRTAA